jgi:hypothetical protein
MQKQNARAKIKDKEILHLKFYQLVLIITKLNNFIKIA